MTTSQKTGSKPELQFCKSFTPILILVVLLSVFPCRAQWTGVNIGTNKNLFAVDYYSTNDIWIGLSNGFASTSTNGSAWTVVSPIVDFSSFQLVGDMYDVDVISPSSGNIVGFYFLGNSERIFQTVNSGSTWNPVSIDNSGSLLRYLNAIDRNGSICLAVGSNGHIQRSTDYGSTWQLKTSGTTNLIKDVKFITPASVIAAGEYVILRSADAGLTWSNASMPSRIHSLSCKQNTVYAGLEMLDSLYKSVDGGQTFTSLALPFSYGGVVYAVSADTVLAAGNDGLYVSINGGLYWEKYILNAYHPIQMMDFLSSSLGIAVGDSGYAIRTTNLNNAPSLPVAGFTTSGSTNFCMNDSLTFSNQTAPYPSYTYAWRLDGVLFSTQYNTGLRLNTTGSHTVSLTVTNSSGSTSVSQQFTVYGHDSLPFVIQNVSASDCPGNQAILIVPNSQSGVMYRLRTSYTNIGSSQVGNGSTLTFNSGSGVTSTTVFNILASTSNACFNDSNIVYITINPISGGPRLACIPGGNNPAGISNVTLNTLNNTSPTDVGHYTNYACQLNTDLFVGDTYSISISSDSAGFFAVWIDFDTSGTFTGNEQVFISTVSSSHVIGNFTIPPTYRLIDTPLRMRVAFDITSSNLVYYCGYTYCYGEYEDYSVTVKIAHVAPSAVFSFTSATTCATSVTFSNSSFNSVNYLWDFGDGDTSTLLAPVHVYSSSGSYIVSLIATNSYGSDTASQTLVIQNPSVPAPAFCDPTADPGLCTRVYSSGIQMYFLGSTHQVFSGGGTAFKEDVTCTAQITLPLDSSCLLTYSVSYCNGYSCVWVDWNNDGVFNNTNEKLITGNLIGCSGIAAVNPGSTAALDVPLRVRIITSANYIPTNCTVVCGQFVDFSIIVHSYPGVVPAFTANVTSACVPDSVTFTNTTVNASSYSWDFGDGSTSTLSNPTHTYSTPGIYTVKLVACNGAGSCDSLIRPAYINMIQTQFTVNPVICQGQTYQVGSNFYSVAGTYVDSLPSILGCDSIITTNLTIGAFPTVTISASGPTTFCEGDSVILTASSGLSGWQWYRSNLLLTGFTNQTCTAKVWGRYWCQGYNVSQCPASSNSIRISVPCVPANQSNIRVNPYDEDTETDFTIYPNPGRGLFTIRSPKGRLEIFSYTGSLIFTREIDEGISEVDLREFSDGIYLLTVYGAFRHYSKYVVVTRD